MSFGQSKSFLKRTRLILPPFMWMPGSLIGRPNRLADGRNPILDGRVFGAKWLREKFRHGNALYFEFKPLTEAESPNARNVPGYAPSFRKTLKLRVRFDGNRVRYSELRAYGESRWNVRHVDIETGCEESQERRSRFLRVRTTARFLIRRHSQPPRRGLRLTVRYTEHPPESADRTILTIRSGNNAFGVSMDDLLTKKDIYVRPFGIFIGDTASGATFRSYVESGRMRPGDDIMSRVSESQNNPLSAPRVRSPHWR